MKKYKLKRDLPTFKAGDKFFINDYGDLIKIARYDDNSTPYGHLVYTQAVLHDFPNILTEWFEEIPEEPKTVWDLKEGEVYYYISWGGRIEKTTWDSFSVDEDARTSGNCFLTEREAVRELARRKAKQILLRDTKGFKPDWSDSDQDKTLVYYDSDDKTFKVVPWSTNAFGSIYFGSLEDAHDSIDAHEKEWKTYLGVEE